MEAFKIALKALTKAVCLRAEEAITWWRQLLPSGIRQGFIPYPNPDLDFDRQAVSGLLYGLHSGMVLYRFSELEAVIDAAANDPELVAVDAVGLIHVQEGGSITHILVTNFLLQYLRNGSQLGWDDRRFEETFNELITALRDRIVVFHVTMPLSNLKVEVDRLDFGDELSLQPASPEEVERWLNPELGPFGFFKDLPRWNSSWNDKPGALHARRSVVGKTVATVAALESAQRPEIEYSSAITALRLVLNTPISVMFEEHVLEGLVAFGGTRLQWGSQTPFRVIPPPTLDRENAVRIAEVWRLLQKSPNIALLKLPIRRWESSLIRTNLEDKLIDAWVGLEALLDIARELRYRASLRLAELLGKNGPSRQEIYDAAKDSYDARSAIVHGNFSKKAADQNKLEETVGVTTQYLREALLKVLEMDAKFDPDDLESTLLTRG